MLVSGGGDYTQRRRVQTSSREVGALVAFSRRGGAVVHVEAEALGGRYVLSLKYLQHGAPILPEDVA